MHAPSLDPSCRPPGRQTGPSLVAGALRAARGPSGPADASDRAPGPLPLLEPSELSAADPGDITAQVRM